ncbi:nuclear transport factor 2 family protein [Qipengyuania spongiae]|uniref:Nuclear transport factor 2 family protein n=1 Tax=Qipengyuania spongiae TaxID=2909673 RepID=A0ABY5SY44_9SPHN|nr:nuclear transport factor 2 family protein [Qipengyuania spongiae]UVI38058.1 nuclear transport factor 2 family protein [Qipengyuania spongiae]
MPRKLFHPETWFRSGDIDRTYGLVRLMNARDYAGLEQALHDDFVYLDTAGSPIRGRGAFLAAARELHRIAPDLKIETDQIFRQEGEIHIKGHLISADPEHCSESLWRVSFDEDGKASELQAFRVGNAVSVTRMTAHLRRPSTVS